MVLAHKYWKEILTELTNHSRRSTDIRKNHCLNQYKVDAAVMDCTVRLLKSISCKICLGKNKERLTFYVEYNLKTSAKTTKI